MTYHEKHFSVKNKSTKSVEKLSALKKAIKERTPSEKDLVEYFFLFKKITTLHKKLKFGEAPRSSEGFTENLCCYLFEDLKRAKGVKRKHDLNNEKTSKKYEVKGTTNDKGRTTINPTSDFQYLYWVILASQEDKIVIHKIKKLAMKVILDQHKDKKRVHISLSKFSIEETTEHFFDYSKQKIESKLIKKI